MKPVYLILPIIFFAIFSLSFGEIYEYRDVVFYPNGTQTIDISKLYVDYENSESFSIYIFYRNTTTYLSYPKNITIDLSPQKFNISVTIFANKINEDEWEVYYKITNNYSQDILFNVSFPEGFNIKNMSILVPANSYRVVTLSKIQNSNTLYFGEHNISFEVPTRVKIRYSLSIPFSIIKSSRILSNGSIEWTAIYIIKNDKNVSLNVNVSYWANVNNKKINFGNYSYTLNPNENITQSFKIVSDHVPIFYLKFYACRDIYKNIKIKPALKVGNSYIIGIAKVKDVNFNIAYRKKIEGNNKEAILKNEVVTKSGKRTSYKTGEQRQKEGKEKTTSNKEEIHKSEGYKQESREFPVIIEEEKKEKIKKVAVATVTTTTTLTLMFIPPLFRRSPDIADKGIFTIDELKILHSTIYVPEGCELGKILPGGISVIQLTDTENEVAKDLHDIYDIPINSAKAMILGVKYGGRIFLSDKKAYRLALKIGLEAYFFNEVN